MRNVGSQAVGYAPPLLRATAGAPWRFIPLGIAPFLLSLPFLYVPKALEGDTQPWVFFGAFLSFLFFWPPKVSNKRDTLIFCLLAFACFAGYFFRAEVNIEMARYVYQFLIFGLMWAVCRRDGGRYAPAAVKATIVIWLAIGVYQTIAVRLGLPIEFAGRYYAERSGVPSLTAEPSFYGSLSVVQMMYVLVNRKPGDLKYVLMALASVVLSGSALAMLMLIVPLFRLKLIYQILGIVAVFFVTAFGFDITSSGFFNRLMSLAQFSDTLELLLRDESLNLRFGHLYFTVVETFWTNVLYLNDINFMVDYNSFAFASALFIPTGNNFIVTAAGDLIYNSGAAGAVLLVALFVAAYRSAKLPYDRLEKIAFTALCLINPIGIANPFFILYLQQERRA